MSATVDNRYGYPAYFPGYAQKSICGTCILYDWRLVTRSNMYRLKIKGKKKSIYFFPSKNIDPAFGFIGKDTSKMGVLLKKLDTN
ncbi:MAG: hypothetical protein EBR30_13395 [Cytophagia bacterium]|nr:hypothetical protein [Cytophagia bacterium]